MFACFSVFLLLGFAEVVEFFLGFEVADVTDYLRLHILKLLLISNPLTLLYRLHRIMIQTILQQKVYLHFQFHLIEIHEFVDGGLDEVGAVDAVEEDG